uniref:hypothetical protein n=1 Tax=Chitinimonas sp. TaxID=1934313 RepID=UPI0035AD7E76
MNTRVIFGLLLDARSAEPGQFLEFFHSLARQSHSDWRMVVVLPAQPLARLAAVVDDYRQRDSRIVAVLSDSHDAFAEAWQRDVAQCFQLDFVMPCEATSIVSHDALLRCISLLADRPFARVIRGGVGVLSGDDRLSYAAAGSGAIAM